MFGNATGPAVARLAGRSRASYGTWSQQRAMVSGAKRCQEEPGRGAPRRIAAAPRERCACRGSGAASDHKKIYSSEKKLSSEKKTATFNFHALPFTSKRYRTLS
eukprot:COSAG05_NODE_156_length_15696_cov_359.955440_8_plen_104_part_00